MKIAQPSQVRFMKAFVVGFPKSGTTTLHQALLLSGITSAHWRIPKGYVGELIYKEHTNGRDPLGALAGYQCVSQADVCIPDQGLNYWPNLDFAVISRIIDFHPDIVFLLNYRSPTKVASSIRSWEDLRARIRASDVPGLPKGLGGDASIINWIQCHYAACRKFLGPSRLVEFDIESSDAPLKIGQVFGVKLAWWGVANQNPLASPDQICRAPDKN